MVNGYKDLFEADGEDALQAAVPSDPGRLLRRHRPVDAAALRERQPGDVNTAAQNICGDLTRGSLGLDKAILACVFHFIEDFCPKANADDNLIISVKFLRWRLDDVVFDWGASPPPPPPVVHGAV